MAYAIVVVYFYLIFPLSLVKVLVNLSALKGKKANTNFYLQSLLISEIRGFC